MFADLPEAELRVYRSSQRDPDDFDEFWSATLAESRSVAREPVFTPVDAGLTTLDVYDVTFSGFGGDPIRAWLRVPAGASGPLPCVVQYVGYGGGRGRAWENLYWASAGFAHLQMDTRGQGSGWSVGETPDPHGSGGPQVPGVMTRGIRNRDSYYYRRLMTDAVLALDAARAFERVDPARVAVVGGSQGGALALAAAALGDDVAAVVAGVPFLGDFPRALVLTDAYPFKEVGDYLATHRDEVDAVLATLAYFDSVNFARRATAPARFSVALMDPITPPSTVFASYNAYSGEKQIAVWPFNGHEAGGPDDDSAAGVFLGARLRA